MPDQFTADIVLDSGLDYFEANADLMNLTQGEPTTYANCIADVGVATGQRVSTVAMAPGDFTVADGDVSGRKITSSAKATIAVVADGTGDYVVYLDSVNSAIIHYYKIAIQRPGLTTADTVNYPTHNLEMLDTVPV